MASLSAAPCLELLAASPGSCPSPPAHASISKTWRVPVWPHKSLPPSNTSWARFGVSLRPAQACTPGRQWARVVGLVRAESKENPLAPLEPESPAGQFLAEILRRHPHLFPAAADQQLERLGAEEEQRGTDPATSDSGDLVLYRRIAEVQSAERKRAIEEVIYALIVQRFLDAGAPLLPQVPFLPADTLSPGVLLAPAGAPSSAALLGVHSEEVREMVLDHLSMVLGERPAGVVEERVLVQTSKMRLGQVYAASIMYGYFLRRVDQRLQLEKTMRLLEGGQEGGLWEAFQGGAATGQEGGSEGDGSLSGKSVGKEPQIGALRQYVMAFGQEALQQAATMRSREGVNVIEKHTEALFGRPEVTMSEDGGLAVTRDEAVRVTMATLQRMILEAVAFGSFLWDVESYVDSRVGIANH